MRPVTARMLSGMAVVFAALTTFAIGDSAPSASGDPSQFRVDAAVNGENVSPFDVGSRMLARVAAATTPAVVHIQSERRTRRGTIEETGSGVIMRSPKADGEFIVTNRHVILGAELADIQVHLHDGRVITPVGKEEDAATDIAVLRLKTPGLTFAEWADSDNVDIGHMVMAMGSPFGLSQSVTLGIISAKGRRALELGESREVINQDFLQTDAAINPGNSGGPLVDLHGRVVGINTAIASQGGGNEGIGFSIPSNLVRIIVEQLLEYGEVQRGYLGVRLDDSFDAAAAARLKLDRARGARVVQVYPNTPAEKAGIQVDDVILNFDGYDIEDEEHLIHRVSLTGINKSVRVIVHRNGRQVTLQVVLTQRPAANRRSDAPRPMPQPFPGGARIESSGLTLHRLDAPLAAQLGVSGQRDGLLVMQVPDRAGDDSLQLYDVILEAARKPVRTVGDWDAVLEQQESVQGPLLLKVRRVVNDQPVTRLVLWTPPAAE
ncbi:trypsin-like peptidase domain-containing protein [Maioricimonas sp. JC845]|uniref:trypsin-like peptidase domain-containing protein n=1 Tax=Maioricimonas sp. JC845 TaxID=3232138 RepID=UPI0034599D0D